MATARIGYKRYQGYLQIYICKGCYSCSHTFRYIAIIRSHMSGLLGLVAYQHFILS